MRRRLAFACGLAVLLSGRAVMGQTCTASTSGLAFSPYDPFAAAPSNITGTVSVTCRALIALGLSYTIQLDGGAGGTIASRAMSNGASRLGYQLYTNPARSVVWGDGTGGTATMGDGYLLAALATILKTYTIYGSIPARQMAAVGGYVDTVTILVSY